MSGTLSSSSPEAVQRKEDAPKFPHSVGFAGGDRGIRYE